LDPNAGKGPGAYQSEPKKSRIDAYFAALMTLTYVVTCAFVVYQRFTLNKLTETQKSKRVAIGIKDILILFWKIGYIIFGMVIVMKINATPPEEFNFNYGSLAMLIIQYLVNPLLFIGACVGYRYFRNPPLQNYFLRQCRLCD